MYMSLITRKIKTQQSEENLVQRNVQGVQNTSVAYEPVSRESLLDEAHPEGHRLIRRKKSPFLSCEHGLFYRHRGSVPSSFAFGSEGSLYQEGLRLSIHPDTRETVINLVRILQMITKEHTRACRSDVGLVWLFANA